MTNGDSAVEHTPDMSTDVASRPMLDDLLGMTLGTAGHLAYTRPLSCLSSHLHKMHCERLPE